MTYMPDDDGTRTFIGGVIVQAAAALHPDQTSADIFSISGRIILLGLVGEVTVAVPANHDYSLEFDPDNGGANVNLGTTLEVDSDAAGTFYTLPTTAGGALVATTNIAYGGYDMMIDLGAGDIQWTTAGGGTVGTTTRVRWDLHYVPVDTGVTVTAV